MRVFFDTNVLVYLYDNDAQAKQACVQKLLIQESERSKVLLSTQVLQEFFVVVTRKLAEPMSSEEAERVVRRLAAFSIVQVDTSLILKSITGSRRHGFSFWDSLIVQAAIEGGASILFTEDMQHGQLVEGLKILNPFMDLGQ